MKIFLGVLNAKVGREDILETKIGNESLHKISNDNETRKENFATSQNLFVKSTMLASGSFTGADSDTYHYLVVQELRRD